jgi:hypothetical protein
MWRASTDDPHIGALPLEEMVPALAGTGTAMLAVRASIMLRVRRRREPRT